MKNISTKKLYTYMRNALHTGATCGGHSKSHFNHVRANEYRDILNERGENLPTYDLATLCVDDGGWRSEQIKLGEFNGDGSQ